MPPTRWVDRYGSDPGVASVTRHALQHGLAAADIDAQFLINLHAQQDVITRYAQRAEGVACAIIGNAVIKTQGVDTQFQALVDCVGVSIWVKCAYKNNRMVG